MRQPLTQVDFSTMGCHEPGCDHTSHEGPMFIHPACHKGTPTFVSYEDGVITITCAECENLVARIEVARGEAAA